MLVITGCHGCDHPETPKCWESQAGYAHLHNWEYELLCPANGDPKADCASWFECGCKSDDPYEMQDEPCPTSPTGEHRYFSFTGGLCCPTSHCFVQENDGLGDAVSYLDVKAFRRYPVTFEVEDETDVSLEIVTSVRAAG